MIIDKNEISQYLDDGVVVLRNVITKYWINELSIGSNIISDRLLKIYGYSYNSDKTIYLVLIPS